MASSTSRLAREAGLIAAAARLAHRQQSSREVRFGIGDDTALLNWRPPAGGCQLLTTDMLVESVHFDLRCMSLTEVGWKAMAVNLSDIASMGGRPRFALGTLGLPPGATTAQTRRLLAGVEACARDYGVELIGGDTFAAPQWIVGFTLLGEAGKQPLLRSGARPGDLLWLSRPPGLSQIGLHCLWGKAQGQVPLLRGALARRAQLAHSRPRPELVFSGQLSELGARACIDTSDSLAQSLLHLASASAVGVRLEFSPLTLSDPLPRAFAAACRQFAAAPPASPTAFVVAASHDPSGQPQSHPSLAAFLLASSEDYSLLFAAAPPAAARIEQAVPSAVVIGVVVEARRGCRYRDEDGRWHRLTGLGWQHR